MAQHFHGVVSRFAAGGTVPANPTAGTPALGRGISTEGARQLLAGDALTTPGDRRALVALVVDALTLTAGAPPTPIGLLLPAVQKIREAAVRLQQASPPAHTLGTDQLAALQRRGVSGPGAQQVGAGLAVADRQDRAALAALLRAAFG